MHNLSIRKLTKIYDKRTVAGLKDFNLDISKGEILSVIGPSGSGKTTLLKCLTREINDYSGEIMLLPETQIALIEKSDRLNHSLSVLSNLLAEIENLMNTEQAHSQIRTTLSLLELTNEIDKNPQELSSGQYQRVLIAKALIKNPSILLLDEAFSSLDEHLRVMLIKEHFKLFKEKEISVIFVTHHNQDALQFSDKVAVLNFGKLEQLATPRDLYQSPNNLFIANFLNLGNCFVTTFSLQANLQSEDFVSCNIFAQELTFELKLWPFTKDILISKCNGVIIIPEEAFDITDKGRMSAKIVESSFLGYFQRYKVVINERALYIRSPLKKLSIGERIRFNIKVEDLKFLPEV